MDNEELRSALEDIEVDYEYVQTLVDELVNSCCEKLDSYVSYISNLINDPDYELTNTQLDDIIMTIPTILYYVGTQQEKIGIKHDVSKHEKSIVYNDVLKRTEGTAGVKKAAAENETFYESLVTSVFSSAYEMIKSKTSYATELLQSAKKIMSRRISEIELSRITPNKERM